VVVALVAIPSLTDWYKMNLTAVAEEIRTILGDYLGLLEYGSRARGTSSANSDLDLIAVTNSAYTPSRFHATRVDLNLISLQSLESLRRRVLINEEAPWDGMFASIRVIDSVDPRVEKLIHSIREAFLSPRELSHIEVDGLRFSLARVIDDLIGISDPHELRLLVGQAVHVYLLSWVMLKQERWSGLREAWRAFRISDQHSSQQLGLASITATWEESVAILRSLESALFAHFGGPWRDGIMCLAGGFEHAVDDRSRPLSIEQTAALKDLCSRAPDPSLF
jgi:predicted nucleotidyltransferase